MSTTSALSVPMLFHAAFPAIPYFPHPPPPLFLPFLAQRSVILCLYLFDEP
jgi:hypothetical protein